MKKKSYIDSKSNKISLVTASLTNKQLQDRINALVQEKLRQFGQEITAVIEQHHDPQLPLSIFASSSSTLEIIVQYLHEVEHRNFADIAILLHRDQRTIWHAYQRSLRKGIHQNQKKSVARPAKKPGEKSSITIPVSLFSRRQFSPLEVVVSYLHEQHHLSFADISRVLSLSPKTVWTVYRRKMNKEQQKKNES